jgi:phosphoribosylaminoimidazole-succinocarboxamide synthase
METPVLDLQLPGIRHLKSGKVRELFDLGTSLLLVATDRISAFDCVMPDGIPGKGRILTSLSHFWFDRTDQWLPNHRISRPGEALPESLAPFADLLRGRSMIVRKADPLPIECVVRGWLAGSGWKEYRQTGRVCGIRLPDGLQEASELPEPIFTPATKAESGHDENISFDEACSRVGPETAHAVRDLSLRLYRTARDEARSRGLIIADTKFEFGWADGKLILIDEALTPDSSRFWPASDWVPGQPTPSFDKQYLRDYLEHSGWNKQPPAPRLPETVIEQTRIRYEEALKRLTVG